jgi:YfiH family protein
MDQAAIIHPHWPDLPACVGALATTRKGGASIGPYDDGSGGGGFNLGLHCGDDAAAVQQNRAGLQSLLPGRPSWISQVHGVEVVDAATVGLDQPVRVGDASVSDQAGVVCAILTADCLPVLFASLDGKVVGATHAGWRSLSGGVLGATVAQMRARGAGEITAWMGPAIGPSQFEVGQDVLDSFLAHQSPADVLPCFVPYEGRPGKYLADMYSLARRMLARDGVLRVHGGDRCTATERDIFYSYRRDGVTGRQASLIWLK